MFNTDYISSIYSELSIVTPKIGDTKDFLDMHVPESPVGGANAANEQGSHGSSDPKVQKTISIIKDPTDGIRQVWKKSLEVQDSKPKLKDQVRDGLYSPIGKSLQAAIKAGQANTQGAVQKIRALLEDQGAKDRIDDCVRWLILMIAVKEAEFESSKEHRGKSQVPVQDDLSKNLSLTQIFSLPSIFSDTKGPSAKYFRGTRIETAVLVTPE